MRFVYFLLVWPLKIVSQAFGVRTSFDVSPKATSYWVTPKVGDRHSFRSQWKKR